MYKLPFRSRRSRNPQKYAIEIQHYTKLILVFGPLKLDCICFTAKNLHFFLRCGNVNTLQKDVDVNNQIISNNEVAIAGLAKILNEAGYICHKVSNTVAKNAQTFGGELSAIIKKVVSSDDPAEVLSKSTMSDMNLKCPNKGKFNEVSPPLFCSNF